MCAIVTWAGQIKRGQWPQIHRILGELLNVSSVRGTDATGFAAIDSHGDFVADKQPVPSTRFVKNNAEWRKLSSPSCVIAHCRAATHGSPETGDNRNNHPFTSKNLAVAVNGVSPNFRDVAEAHGFQLRTECDSEIFLRLIDAAPDPVVGLHDCLAQLHGGMAVSVLDVSRKVVWLIRNESRPLWLLRVKGLRGHIVCSTQEIATVALQRCFGDSWNQIVEILMPIADGHVIGVADDGRISSSRRAAPIK